MLGAGGGGGEGRLHHQTPHYLRYKQHERPSTGCHCLPPVGPGASAPDARDHRGCPCPSSPPLLSPLAQGGLQNPSCLGSHRTSTQGTGIKPPAPHPSPPLNCFRGVLGGILFLKVLLSEASWSQTPLEFYVLEPPRGGSWRGPSRGPGLSCTLVCPPAAAPWSAGLEPPSLQVQGV